MKAFRTSLVGAALTLVAGYAAGCGGSNTTTGGGGGTTTTTTTDPSGEQPLAACSKQGELTGSVSTSRTLTQDTCWTMKGIVYVEPGATLTVEKGTKIAGDPTSLGVLVVKPGAKLVARGTAANPIVFTSSKPKGQRAKGDWGGIILLGKATTNAGVGFITGIEVSDSTLFGGDDDADSSGALEYVRIEFGGGRIGMDSSYNGLTLGAVGSGTLIDHVMVKEGLDDCFGFFGGAVNLKHLICANPDDDGLDWDMGYHGKLQFVAVIQDPVTDAGDDEESNGLEGDNDPMGTETTPRSEPTMYNVTLCGKDKPTMPQYGLLLRRGTKGALHNLIATGFEAGVDIRDGRTSVELRSSIFFGNGANNVAYVENGSSGLDWNDDAGLDELAWFNTAGWKNAEVNPGLRSCVPGVGTPDFRPTTTLTANAATPPSDGFFDATAAYVGAFSAEADWAPATWADFSRN